jgi:hypothetical protein
MQSFSESQWDAFAFLSQHQTRSTADLPMRLFAAGAPNGQVVVLGGAEGGALHRVQTEAARRRGVDRTRKQTTINGSKLHWCIARSAST